MLWLMSASVKSLPDPNAMPEPTREQIGDFYVRLGYSVAAWQFVESSIVHIFSSAIGASQSSYEAVCAAFHKPSNFRTRLEMTDEAVTRTISDSDILSVWKSLNARAIRQSITRNKIAHSLVIFDPAKKPGKQLFLAPNVSDPSRFDGKFSQKNTITQAELESSTINFQTLNRDLWDFALKLPRPVRLAEKPSE